MKLTTTLLALALASAATTTLHAVDYYWWVSGNATPGGTGEWNTTSPNPTPNWSDNVGGYNPLIYTSTATSNAIFGGTAGKVTFLSTFTAITMDNWQVDAPNYIFDLAGTGRTFTVNQFTGSNWDTATFIGTGTPIFYFTSGQATTFSGIVSTTSVAFDVRLASVLTLASASTVTGTFRLGGNGSTLAGGEFIIDHPQAFGSASLNINSGGTNTITTNVPVLEIANGVTFGNNRAPIFQSSSVLGVSNNYKFVFSNLTATNASFNFTGDTPMVFHANTIFTGAGYSAATETTEEILGLAGAMTINGLTSASFGGTGKITHNAALIQGTGAGANVSFRNTNEMLLTDAHKNSTYGGQFILGSGSSNALPAIVRTTTLNNDNTNGVFGNSSLPIYFGTISTDGTQGATAARAKLIYDSATSGSTNKNFSLGGSANQSSYTTLESAGAGLFEIVGTVGGREANTGGTRYLYLDGSGNGRIGPAATDLLRTSGKIVNSLVSGTCTLTLTKDGTGTWTLDGDNAYTGATTVNAGTLICNGNNTYINKITVSGGTLLLNGNNSDASAVTAQGYNLVTTGHYQVASGATLGGSGNISGNNAQANANLVLVEAGGILAPGSSLSGTNAQRIGTLTIDSRGLAGTATTTAIKALRMAAAAGDTPAAKFSFDLAGNSADRIDFWGFKGTTVATSSVTFNNTPIDLNLLNGIATAVDTYYEVAIFTFYSDGGITEASHFFTSGLVIGSYDTDRIYNPQIFYNSGGAITLGYTVLAIPEPASLVLLGMSLFVVTLFRKKKLS